MSESADEKLATPQLAKVMALGVSEPFRWFMREAVIAEMDRQDEIIHDRSKSFNERETALDTWHALKRVRDWPDETRRTAAKLLGHQSQEKNFQYEETQT